MYGPRTAVDETRRCRISGCGRPLPPGSRRHECCRCRVAASRGRIVAGPCAVCGTGDRRVLTRAELVDGPVVLCANDRAVLGRLRLTLAELRAEVAGEAAA